MRAAPVVLARTALVLLALLPGTGWADEATPPPEIQVPVGLPIQLDGRIVLAEWEGAHEVPLAADGSTLRFLQREGTLFLGLTTPRPWPEASSAWFCFTPDTPDAGLYAPGAVRLDFEPREHNRPHLHVVRNDGEGDVPAPGEAIARAEVTATDASVEIALRLSLLGVRSDDAPPVRFALVWMRGSRIPTVTWPKGVSTRAPLGQRPPDLASSRTWARLGGWKNAAGPGALSRTAWSALVETDAELTRRGQEAHARGLQLQETPDLPKQDALVQAAVLDNLEWIAEREPLTAYDLALLARAYRHLNRKAEALAVLDALGADPAWRGSARLLYDRALALESAQRFVEAATTWRALARRSQPPQRAGYEAMAERADERATAWAEEEAARAAASARRDLPLVLLRTTRGNVLVQLLPEQVPEAVRHFLDLVGRVEGAGRRAFYDGTRFHRVEGDFLVQGGDPLSREELARAGSGTGPTTVTAELNPEFGYFRGAVAFARSIARVNGSQFFILVSPRPALEAEGYTVFGHVVAGMDVVDRLEYGDELIEVRRLDGGAPAEAAGEKKETPQ